MRQNLNYLLSLNVPNEIVLPDPTPTEPIVPDPVKDKVSLPARLLIDVIAEFETVANPSYILFQLLSPVF